MTSAKRAFTMLKLPPVMRRDRAAFTMLELLIAIGIILVLLGMLMYGLRAFSNSAKGKETRVTLEIAMGMFSELDAKVRLAQRTDVRQYWIENKTFCDLDNTSPYNNAALELSFWNNPLRDPLEQPPPTAGGMPKPIRAPGKVTPGEDDRTNHEAIWNTAIAMSRFMGMPANRKKIETMPAQRMMRLPDVAPTGIPPAAATLWTTRESKSTILLDGWGNPIIFVPASGLGSTSQDNAGHLEFEAMKGQPRTITSSKIRTPAPPSTDFAVLGTDRPFFASAGPDGNFSTGDDNIYSFEK